MEFSPSTPSEKPASTGCIGAGAFEAFVQESVVQKIGQQPAHTNEIVQGFGLGL
jgi:hypothetical protein